VKVTEPVSFERDNKHKKMTQQGGASRFVCVALVLGLFMIAFMTPEVDAQASAPAPSPASDGTVLGQSVACLLLVVALVSTYLIPLNGLSSYL